VHWIAYRYTFDLFRALDRASITAWEVDCHFGQWLALCSDVSGVEFEVVKTTPFIDRNGHNPAHSKESNDAIPEDTEVIVEFADQSPKCSSQVKLSRQQPQRLSWRSPKLYARNAVPKSTGYR
jgi:hypothetical protein